MMTALMIPTPQPSAAASLLRSDTDLTDALALMLTQALRPAEVEIECYRCSCSVDDDGACPMCGKVTLRGV